VTALSTTFSTTTAFGALGRSTTTSIRPTATRTTATRTTAIRKRRTIKTTPISRTTTTRRPTSTTKSPTSRTTVRKIQTWLPLRWETPVWKSTTKKPQVTICVALEFKISDSIISETF